MQKYFKKLFRYNQWANQGLCNLLKDQPLKLSEVMQRISHIVAAEEIWYHRIKPLDFDLLPLFEVHPRSLLFPRAENSAKRWLDLIENIDNFQKIISYQNTKGAPYQSPLSDILIHVANHGTYHRGQIATLMRASGVEPLVTDFIAFCRVDH